MADVPRRLRGAAVLAVALVAAACTSDPGVSTESARPIDDGSDPPVHETPDGELPLLSVPDPDTVAGTLDNGLRYVIRDNDNPGGKAELRLAIDAGSVLEDGSQLGGAHFLEHMLFNGTERFPKNELVAVLRGFGAAFGADVNARTSYDDTVYELSVPNEDEVVETGLDVLEDWLSFATIDPNAVEAERGIVLDEWRSRSQTASGRVSQAFADFVLEGTAYAGQSPIGGRDEIESLTAEDLRRFYDDWYRPDNASVIVVGEIDPAEVEDWIVERFADAEPRAEQRERPDVSIGMAGGVRVEVVPDPEIPEGSVDVLLPIAVDDSGPPEAVAERGILDGLVLDVIATRLNNDALRGDAPFEAATVTSASIVRELDAPGISVDVEGAGVPASVDAVVAEFERVERHGVSQAELDRAAAVLRSSTESFYAGRDSRQDVSFADEYVRHVLEGEWYVTADQEFAFVNAVLDRATTESATEVFSDRYATGGLDVFVAVRDDEAEAVPATEELVTVVTDAQDRDVEPRDDVDVAVADELMARPDTVDEVRRTTLLDEVSSQIVDPIVLEFDNGARVALNTTPIVEGQVFVEARSPGGLAAVADDDVPDGQALGDVLSDSGAGPFDRVALEAFLDDKDVVFQSGLDTTTDVMGGTAATADLEILLQLVHQLMTAPRADETAVDRYVDDRRPLAIDPTIDAGSAESVALLTARYDDDRYLLPTPESLEVVDAEGIERVAEQRFGDPADWSFSFSGDFVIEDVVDLVRSYIGSLPTGGDVDSVDFTEPPPPEGVVTVEAEAGQGAAAKVSFLYTSTATAQRSDDVLGLVVREVVSNRLIDVIREELGDSYSPFANVSLGRGGEPMIETYISVSTTPELADEVSDAVTGQLASLRSDGPSDQEFDDAIAAVSELLGFTNNAEINSEILGVLVDPGGNASLDDYVTQFSLTSQISDDDVRNAIVEWLPEDQYIEVRIAAEG